jgi:hypothetical protein
MSRRRRRHSWALEFRRSDPEVRALSVRGQTGLFYASNFARNAKERTDAMLAGQELPERLDASDLGSAIEVYAAIKQARIELFGKDLSNSAIAYRMQQRRGREPCLCADPGCFRPLTRLAHASKRYCEGHASGKARARRHRRLHVQQASTT